MLVLYAFIFRNSLEFATLVLRLLPCVNYRKVLLGKKFFVHFLFFNICPLLKVQVFSFALPLHNKASVYITNSLVADSTRTKTNVTNFAYRKKVGITEMLFEGGVNVNY